MSAGSFRAEIEDFKLDKRYKDGVEMDWRSKEMNWYVQMTQNRVAKIGRSRKMSVERMGNVQ